MTLRDHETSTLLDGAALLDGPNSARIVVGRVADSGSCQSASVLFDTHCHFDFDEFADDRPAFLRRARERGITQVVVPGVSPRLWERQARVMAECGMRGAYGVHPFWAHEVTSVDLAGVLAHLERALADEAIVAVGECGLDRPCAERGAASLAWQADLLEQQLRIAQRAQLPVILHCVRAHGRLIEILDALGPLPKGGVLHAYSGSAELIPRYVEHGMYFGFGGAVTKPAFARVRQALLRVPDDRLVLETDAPDQSPAWRSARNEPAELLGIAQVVADLRGVPLAALASQTSANARGLFGLSEGDRLG